MKNTKQKSRRLRRQDFCFGGGRWIRPPAGGPGRGSDVPPARHSLPLPSNPPVPNKEPVLSDELFVWWGKVDSNHRRHCQQIYSLSPLATREFPHIQFTDRSRISEQSPAKRVYEDEGGAAEGASFRRLGGSETIRSLLRRGGAGGRTRTPDLLITNQLLYQLSYTSIEPA